MAIGTHSPAGHLAANTFKSSNLFGSQFGAKKIRIGDASAHSPTSTTASTAALAKPSSPKPSQSNGNPGLSHAPWWRPQPPPDIDSD